MSERPTLADFGFFHELVTRWSDCDMLGHINNARYFTFDESARLDYFDPMIRVNSGFWKDSGFILARIECEFIAQIHHPAQVKFGFRIRRIGRSSMNTERSEEHTSELQSLMRISYAVFCLKKNT